ncbi:hypothetical protein D9613_005637 [Agrocybe pediades]|uniref:Protein BZZ1 n=1 Tax=Agrocybe pediades TaxID=84607 RepID=A0A8H4QUG9_9AGAR|nr:hypothetical protein D9613_005637 [Agrocybe pediades]
MTDQVERISQLFDAQLEVIGDVRPWKIQELYSARVALEREYATKLQTLTRKAAEKKAKSGESYIVGNEPTKITDPTVLRQHTLDVAYNAIISSMTDTAQDHMNFADALTVQGLDVLRTVARRNEETKKKEMTFFQKLLSDRDRIYADRLKCKQKGRASDDRHADRAARQAEQQRNEMLNSKNSYIISIAVANQVKDKFYTEDVPNLENRRLLERMAKILSHGQTLQEQHLDALKSRISFVKEKIDQVDVVKDQDLFIDHNIRPFNAPNNWAFEPCPNHYDTEEINVEEAPKIVIQNKLRRTQGKLAELKPLTESKRRAGAESKLLASQITSYIPDTSVGAIDDLTDNHLEVEHQLTSYASSERILETEIKTVLGALGGQHNRAPALSVTYIPFITDDLGSSAPHSFKSSSFTIPTPCGYCKSSIWGLSRQGKTCRACGLSVHAKCELKVPANCQAASGEDLPRHSHGSIFSRKSISKSQRSEEGGFDFSSSMSCGANNPCIPDLTPSIAPSASSFVESSSSSHDEDVETAEVLFDFEANSEFELQVKVAKTDGKLTEGQVVRIVEADDGSGWIKVADQEGNSGLVPATYLRILTDESEAVAPEDNEQKRAHLPAGNAPVRALYPYTAQGPDELSIQPDEILTLSTGPTGGENYGNGWCEGYNPQGKRGIFPSNYVEHL